MAMERSKAFGQVELEGVNYIGFADKYGSQMYINDDTLIFRNGLLLPNSAYTIKNHALIHYKFTTKSDDFFEIANISII